MSKYDENQNKQHWYVISMIIVHDRCFYLYSGSHLHFILCLLATNHISLSSIPFHHSYLQPSFSHSLYFPPIIAGNSSKESIFRIPDSGVGDTESISSIEIGSNNSSSTVGTPTETPKFRPPFCQQLRERLYCASPGCYVVNQDVQPQQPGDLTLWKGMVIEGGVIA